MGLSVGLHFQSAPDQVFCEVGYGMELLVTLRAPEK